MQARAKSHGGGKKGSELEVGVGDGARQKQSTGGNAAAAAPPRVRKALKPLPPMIAPSAGEAAGEPWGKDMGEAIEERSRIPKGEWEIPMSDIVVGPRVGVGNFAEVFRGTYRCDMKQRTRKWFFPAHSSRVQVQQNQVVFF